MAETLKEKTAKGLFWGGMNNFVQQVVGLVFGIILGRLLSPSDYGMIAMITIFSQIANAIQNSGFGAALTNLDHPTDEDYNSVFWFNVTASTTMYVILFFCAPLIADFYHTPALVPLSRYVFLSFVFSSFATAPYAYLFKNFQAKLQTKSGIIAVVSSSVVGAVLAFLDFGYWALATQSLVFVAVSSIMAWHYSAWHPTLHIDYRPAMRMFKFSCKILATTIVTQINNNVLNILLGHYFSAHDTGNYNQAYQWDSKCFNLVQGMVNQVAQPVLVDLRSNQGRQLQALRKLMRFTSFIAFPLLLGFGLVAREFIVLTITAKWLPSAELLQLLVISGATFPLVSLLSSLVISEGRSGLYFWITASLGVVEIGLMLLLYPYGIRTMVIAYVLVNIVWLFVWHFFVNRMVGYSLWQFLKDTMPFALAALGVMVATHLLTSAISNLWLLLFSRIIIAVLLYYAVMRVARVKILQECVNFIFKKKR